MSLRFFCLWAYKSKGGWETLGDGYWKAFAFFLTGDVGSWEFAWEGE